MVNMPDARGAVVTHAWHVLLRIDAAAFLQPGNGSSCPAA
jgi:hypothetical protein